MAAKGKPLTKAGMEQLRGELDDAERAETAAKAAEDPGTVSVSVKAAGWKRGLSVKIVIPGDD
jgi:hypothetical protein